MPRRLSTVNFGSAFAGLATVGYTIYKPDGSTQSARTTTGVAEIGTSTGNYKALIDYPSNFQGYVLWDTGGASVRYASESINPVDSDSIADEMRTMLRSLNISLSSYLQRALVKKDLGSVSGQIEERKKELAELAVLSNKIHNSIAAINVNPVVQVDTEQIRGLVSELKESIRRNSDANVAAELMRTFKTSFEKLNNEMRSHMKAVINGLMSSKNTEGTRAEEIKKAVQKALDESLEKSNEKLSAALKELLARLEKKSKAEDRLESFQEMLSQMGVSIEGLPKKQPISPDLLSMLVALRGGRRK